MPRIIAAAIADQQVTSYALAGAASAGATTITLDRTAAPRVARQIVAIDAFTPECELRTVTAIAGTVLTVSALEYAHSADDPVIFIDGGAVPAVLFGCKGDGSTDDHTAFQWGARQCHQANLWLDLQNRVYIISQPVLAGSSCKWRNGQITAKTASPTFAPAESNNAMVMMYAGNVKTFTATAADDTFVTPTDHGIPAANIGVVFQGTNLPTGITAGKYYYARDIVRSSPTWSFKVSTTSGGAAVDLTADGSGTAFCEVYSLGRLLWDDIYVYGSDIAGLNGVLANVQQPSFWHKVRIQACPGVGAILQGQQMLFYNTIVTRCGTGMRFDGLSLCDFYGTNVETINTGPGIGLHFNTNVLGNTSITFWGLHFETITNAAIHITQGVGLHFSRVHTNSAGPLVVCDGTITNTGYHIENAYWATDDATYVAIDDAARGWTGADVLLERAHFGRLIDDFYAPVDWAAIPTPPKSMWGGVGKGYHRVGGAAVDYPFMESRIPSGQSVDFWKVLDSAGAEAFAFKSDGAVQIKDGPLILAGTGTPEAAVTAPVGSLFLRTDAATSLYVKQTGAGNTGWVVK
jgi:hypothetical protein